MQRFIILFLVIALVALSAGCLEDKVLEIVFTGETSADFAENETDADDDPEIAVLDLAEQIRDILDDNGYELSQIESAKVTSVSYGVLSISGSHDWTVSGEIRVGRTDISTPTVAIVTYSSQSVQGALNQKIPATLQSAGVDLLNQALADFLAGGSPVLTFEAEHGSITPTPSVGDPMVFDWRAWLAIQIIVDQDVEVPDPF